MRIIYFVGFLIALSEFLKACPRRPSIPEYFLLIPSYHPENIMTTAEFLDYLRTNFKGNSCFTIRDVCPDNLSLQKTAALLTILEHRNEIEKIYLSKNKIAYHCCKEN